MSKISLLLVVSVFLVAPLYAQTLVNDREITISSSADVIAKRNALIDQIWGGDGLPADKLPRLPVVASDDSPIPGLADLERVDTLIVDMEAGVKSYAHHFIPTIKNNRLVILHAGHVATFNDSDIPADVGYGMRRAIEGLLGDGYSVLAVYMPLNAAFQTTITVSDDGGEDAHNVLFMSKKYRPKKGTPLKYFLEPVAAYLNYLSSRSAADDFPVYSDYSMVGFSGGGWTATVYAAIDPRIGLSISVAGSMPLYLRSAEEVGDAEQTIAEFYSIAGYPDLYVMGSHGPGRKQIQILNRHDWCCFSEPFHDPDLANGLNFTQAVREYESNVRETLIGLGNTDLFSVEIDEASFGHNVTWDAIYDTILPELNHGRRYVGTATGDEAVARGVRGIPVVMMNGILTPSKISPMVGTPALLRGSVNIYDMFYRNSGNQLVHVSRPPLVWSRAKVLAESVISDPAAASRGPGRFDVVVLGSDYVLYHISQTGSGTAIEPISEDVKGLGQPTLIASGGDQLDLFYKSWNRRLYHARKVGDSPWVIEDAGGRMVDFPTAVRMNDGSFRAYVRGVDGAIWEARRGIGQKAYWSSWASLSWQVAGGEISGSPSAVVINGVITVYARSPESGIRRFTLNDIWSVADEPGLYSGSPTASPRGVFARSQDGALSYSDGSEWIEFGGLLD